ncbi:sigma-70 family RNA polymerase sigma factor [Pelagibacterium limicola]|uniref:sigma-70 family RNA polymerase sigma factor n=1 Tax=Pelagibacterium limicola TaxID=2791022 RepID=UPI0018AFD798|nr:sigma-70 family RNA polymerase sigma factor [Pelagibacterium limicola]
MSPEKDWELAERMRAALAGDESGYAALLHEVSGLVRGIAKARLAPGLGIDPEDIVQETLLAIHLKRHTWQPARPIGPWIYAIARHKIADACRRRGRRVEIDISDLADTLAAPVEETALARDVERALDGLSEGQRRVVASVGIEGATIGETARRLGMKETAVRVSLHRGLASIAAKFGKA